MNLQGFPKELALERSLLSLGTGGLQGMIHGNTLLPVFALGLRSMVADQAGPEPWVFVRALPHWKTRVLTAS